MRMSPHASSASVALYARVSTDRQAQAQTVESQVAALRERQSIHSTRLGGQYRPLCGGQGGEEQGDGGEDLGGGIAPKAMAHPLEGRLPRVGEELERLCEVVVGNSAAMRGVGVEEQDGALHGGKHCGGLPGGEDSVEVAREGGAACGGVVGVSRVGIAPIRLHSRGADP